MTAAAIQQPRSRLRPCAGSWLVAGLLAGAIGGLAADRSAAQTEPAGFRLCNETLDVFSAAFGQSRDDLFETKGWWVIGPGQCAQLTDQPLHARFVYVLATDPFGKVLVEGATPMCAAPQQFDIRGESDCLARGYLEARYLEVDTKEERGFTLSVYPDAP
ncbi:DUF1036 domain-containing protein [Thioclava sp. GXIMD4216]|uniref:DUF1036 domain-containing protein n=1 Tax=unclassified Thioclava TaxID=2621713 RepID=UPI0030D12579